MRWTRETREERLKRLNQWHKWFAWRPVRIWKLNPRKSHRTQKEVQVLEHSNQVVWMENVMRKFEDDVKIHGHNYELDITIKGDANPESGFIINISES